MPLKRFAVVTKKMAVELCPATLVETHSKVLKSNKRNHRVPRDVHFRNGYWLRSAVRPVKRFALGSVD